MKIMRFESINNFPKVGDYVLLNINNNNNNPWVPEYIEFVNSHIGEVTVVDPNYKKCRVKIYGQWSQFGSKTDECWFNMDEIEYWSEDKEDIKLRLDSRKYNL